MKHNEIIIGHTYKTRVGAAFELCGYVLVTVRRVEGFCVEVVWPDGQRTWLYPENLFN